MAGGPALIVLQLAVWCQAELPVAPFPVPTMELFQSVASTRPTPSPEAVPHLRAAAEHLHAAGFHETANELQELLVQIQRQQQAELTAKRKHLQRLRQEVAQLSDELGCPEAFMIHLHCLELSSEQLAGIDLPLACQFRDLLSNRPAACQLAPADWQPQLAQLIEHRHAKLLASPKLLTRDGQPAIFQSGGMVAAQRAARLTAQPALSGVNFVGGLLHVILPTASRELSPSELQPVGLKCQVTVSALGEHRARCQLELEHAQARPTPVEQTDHHESSSVATRKLSTVVDITGGETLILASPSGDRGQALVTLVTVEAAPGAAAGEPAAGPPLVRLIGPSLDAVLPNPFEPRLSPSTALRPQPDDLPLPAQDRGPTLASPPGLPPAPMPALAPVPDRTSVRFQIHNLPLTRVIESSEVQTASGADDEDAPR